MNLLTIQKIVNLAESRQTYNYQFNRNLEIYEGELNKYIAGELAKELSKDSYEIESKRISSLNIIQRTTDKLSQIYSEKPKRSPSKDIDKDVLEELNTQSNIDNTMLYSEVILNLNKTFALEPYYEQDKLDNRELRIRLLKPDEFCVFSDDQYDTTKMTHFVKFSGQIIVKTADKDEVRNLYTIYSKTEIIRVDSKFFIHKEDPNIYNEIPFVVCKTSNFSLNQTPDTDSYDTTVVIAKLLTGLNFGVHFQSHSTMYSIDVEMPTKISNSPNTMWNLKSNSDNPQAKPSVGILSPTVKVDEVVSLASFYVAQFLEDKGVKTSNTGNTGNANPISAIGKIIDEADTTEVLKFNKELLIKTEKKLWKLISVIHNVLVRTGTLKTKKNLSKEFEATITFEPKQIQPSKTELREDVKFQLDNKLTTKRRALMTLNPTFTEVQIDELVAELEAEEKSKVEQPQDNNVVDKNIDDNNQTDKKSSI